MNICVCMKQVPDTNEIRVDPETHTLIRKGVPSIVNPYLCPGSGREAERTDGRKTDCDIHGAGTGERGH